MELGLWIDIGIIAAWVGIWVRLEFFLTKRITFEGQELHKKTSALVTADSKEAIERVAHQIRNHVEGPAHRR